MIGAIAGDIIGSVYEHAPIKQKTFPLFCPQSTFTDDSVLTLAVADAILARLPYDVVIREVGRRHPHAGYGGMFLRWLHSENPQPYGSWGNGSAMRVSAIGWAFDTLEEVEGEAAASAGVTHNHPEGIKGAQSVALAIWLARNGADKKTIRDTITQRYGYELERSLEGIRPQYRFDVSCAGTVPEAMIAFLDSCDWEDAIRNAVSLGGDADTLACITGGIAEAFYGGVPSVVQARVRTLLTDDLREILERFESRFGARATP